MIHLFISMLVVGVLMTPAIQLLLWFGITDKPNARSSHSAPVVRGGGVLPICVFIVDAAFAGASHPITTSWLAGLAFVATVSFVDDVRSLPAIFRMAIHGLAAAVVMLSLAPPGVILGGGAHALLLFGIGVATIVGYTNAFNFMDGINGLAALQAILAGVGTAMVAISAGLSPSHPAVIFAWSAAGVAAGFLPYNFPKARVFMGDVGSASYGFIFSTLTVWLWLELGWRVGLLVAGLHLCFILDTGVTMLRRLLRRENVLRAHREHFYQRAVRSGLSHQQVTLRMMGIQLVITVASAVVAHLNLGAWHWFVFAAAWMLWGLLFATFEHSFTTSKGVKS